MSLKYPCLWKLGRNLVWAGIGSMILLALTAAIIDTQSSAWLPSGAKLACAVFVVGAIIVWSFAVRFYARVHQSLGAKRSAAYLMILVCMNWASPFIFIALEGHRRFFEDDGK